MNKFLKNGHLIKLISYVTILSLVILVVSFYRVGYIPIFGNKIAEKRMGNYANGQIIKSKFDWINSRYVSPLDNGYSLSYQPQFNMLHDERISIKINDISKNDYETIIKKFPANLKFPDNITVWTSINAEDYTIKAQRLYLLGIYNTDSLSEEESLKMPAGIAQDFIEYMGKEYNFTGIQLLYADKNGMYEIAIPANTFDVLEYQKLLKYTKKYPEQKLPLEYVDWLEQQ